MSDIPKEILSDILVRLPAKSIGRSRCVSKPWLSLLTSYEFVKAHLAHHSHSLAQQQNLFFRSSHGSPFSLTLHLGVNHLRKLEFFDEPVRDLVGSCNGLVFVVTETNVKCLINCLTEEYVKLPDSPYALYPFSDFTMYGFGYDSLSDDYKIVSITPCDSESECEEDDCAPDTFIDIYSLKMRSWRRAMTSPYEYDYLDGSVVFVNGAFHWMGCKNSSSLPVILAFDLSSEELKEIPAPSSLGRLIVVDGCLGMVVEEEEMYTEIWFMNSYSLVESWKKVVIDREEIYCFHKDKVLFEDDGIWQWYYLEDGRVEECLIDDDTRPLISEGITYSESLVSPYFNNHHN